MIKKYILGLFTFITIFYFNFLNAFDLSKDLYVRQNGNYGFSPYDQNFEIQVTNKGNLLTNQLGITLRGIYLRQGTYIVRRQSDYLGGIIPYLSYGYTGYNDTNTRTAGYPKYYAICEKFDGNNHIADYDLTGCNTYELNQSNIELISNFMSTITSTDTFGFNYKKNYYPNNPEYNNGGIIFCYSSNNYNKSICFGISKHTYINDYIYPGFNSTTINYTGYNQTSLPAGFTDLNKADISLSPGNGQNQSGNNNINNSTTNIGNCPTIEQVMQNMGNNYNTGLCYNNTSYFNGTNFEQIEKEDIFTIYNDDYQNYVNRISIYRNNCTNANTTQACQNAFSGEYKKYSIISNAINSNVDEKKLRNYCNLGLNYDPNATTCVASGGGIKEKYTTEELINDITNNGVIPTPTNTTTGENDNVLNALNKCESGDRDCYLNNRNFIESLGNIYGKITGLFKERKNVNGIIPEYILRITFLTILFTVIFKK